MELFKLSEKMMAMDDETWNRHSNPWSVSTRFTILPLISLAVWSREWFGIYSLVPIALSLIWVWVNPRLFRVPKNTNNWASMGTFGERIYLNRKQETVPVHHLKACRVLLALSALGLPFFLYGLYSLNFWILILGNLWVMTFKAWFFDRMVWLYLDMKDTNPTYQAWLKP